MIYESEAATVLVHTVSDCKSAE